MKKVSILLILFLISCGRNSYEKELYGSWYEYGGNGITRLIFKPEKLIIIDYNFQETDWKANKNKIEFNYKTIFPDSIGKSNFKDLLKYNLSKTKDTLFSTLIATRQIKFNLIKADNYINYLNKITELNFELPTNKNADFIKPNGEYSIKIFIGYKNNEVKYKTEFSNDLNTLESDIEKQELISYNQMEDFRNDIEKKKALKSRLHYRLFIDKNISNTQISSVIEKLQNTEVKKIYRIYKTPEYDNLEYMKGLLFEELSN